VIDIEQVAIEVQVCPRTHLDCGVRGLGGDGARRKGHLGVDSIGRERDLGEALGSVFGLVDDDLLDIRVGWLRPMGLNWCHDGV
jgi:hypothetical protein